VETALFVFSLTVLIIRIAIPDRRRRITIVLNYVFLVLFPVGTAMGFMGFARSIKARHRDDLAAGF